ncbi:hypothetical protein [Frankia sp. CiP3]|uniref:hypothetical protein n=1 Tax=Frankia sp. CiP3 TaxID=2880971 RepID=UPI001EF505DD|nr:hypothetical protein [Frankia sp. CiP3]
MANQHRAFALDYGGFQGELAPILRRALDTGDLAPLVAFIDTHRDRLRDPDTGTPLDSHWRAAESAADAHRLGDLALTAYYDPAEDIGLGDGWEEVGMDLAREVDQDVDPLIGGEAFGPPDNPFDPGKLGSYLRSWDSVRQQRERLAEVMAGQLWSDTLTEFDTMLRTTDEQHCGLYVTF